MRDGDGERWDGLFLATSTAGMNLDFVGLGVSDELLSRNLVCDMLQFWRRQDL